MKSIELPKLPKTVPVELPARAAGYGLLASAVVALLPHLPRWPWWLNLLLALLFGWRALMLRRGWPVPGWPIRTTLTVLLVALVFQHYGTILGRDAGSSLLAAMLALKFLELRRLRDYMLAVFLIYFLIMLGFLYSQEPWLVLYLLAVLVATTATLIRLALPRFTGRRAAHLAMVLLAQALPLMLVLHLLFPRIQGSLWGLPHDAYAALTGMSDEMYPGSISELSASDEVAFRAHFPAELPNSADLYWRVLVLSNTNGRIWTRGGGGTEVPQHEPLAPALPYSLTVEPSNKPWLPVLELPVALPPGVRGRGDLTLETPQPIRERVVYELAAHTRYRARHLDGNERRAALALPSSSARVQALARQLHQDRSDRDTVRAALAHFREQEFHYTLTPPLLGDDPVDEFLFETRRGFCEHYAVAFVSLMRSAGIPARVVAGYQGGEFNPNGRYFIVRQSDAHAWAEVYLAENGWTRIDPTAAIAPERVEYGAEALRRLLARGAPLGQLLPGALDLDALDQLRRQARLALDTVRNGWQQWVLGYNAARQRQFLAALGFPDIHPARLVAMLALMVAALLAVYVWVTRARAAPLDPVQRDYLRLCRKLARVGLVRAPHDGPLDFAARCAHQRPDLAKRLHQLTALYVRLRYRPDTDRTHRRLFHQQVASFRPRRPGATATRK